MTKLEVLNTYDSINKIYTWKSLGSNVACSSTPFYSSGIIYRIYNDDMESFDAKGCLVFCKNDKHAKLEWTNATLLEDGYITFGNNIIDPDLSWILDGDSFNESYANEYNEEEFNSFVPFESEENKLSNVVISEDDYALCIQCLGYPFITEEELEYTRGQIINLAIKPALDEYFKWLPKVEIGQYPLNNATSLEVPSPDNAYDIVHYGIQQYGSAMGSGMVTNTILRSFQDTFYSGMSYSSFSGSYGGNRAPRTRTTNADNFFTSRAASQGIINYTQRMHLDKYWKDNKLYARVSSIKGGTAEIHWAIKTLNFNDIEFAQRNNVIDYASCNVKLLFANLRRQAKGDLPGQYDYGQWVSEATTRKSEIVKEWQTIVKASSAIRGSL